ncbi:DUF6233 domain-containing protein [Streptomyces mutabilis]|uniref:Uncharacterized protein n=1 Tax=Streptomyces mutabilis TaxID=67332 RepID=A0A086MR24_9ACTN|nr:DUF6233 domain-containing protein [Streptomyces mutabilis]KFG71342.1 hypothetical protein FM21_34105 [Streptomyces mutabilis]
MNDLPPAERLAKLLALEEWLDWQLRNTRASITSLRADIDQEQAARRRAWVEARWKLEPVRGERRSVLHRGGCTIWKGEHGFLERAEVLVAVEDESLAVEMCSVCRPETGLEG